MQTACLISRRRGIGMDSRASFFCWQENELPPLDSMPRMDAIIHLAGEPVAQRWTPEAKRRIFSSRVHGTRSLVKAVSDLKHKPSALISASAVGYYGDRGDEILTETSQPGSDFLADVCVHWEEEALRAREAGLRVVCVRIATVLGKHGGALPRMVTPFHYGLGAKFGNGQQWMSWIHLEDLVRLLTFAAEQSGLDEPLNGSSPNPVTNAEFTAALARALHRPAFLSAPKFVLRLMQGEMSSFLLNSLRVLPAATQRSGFLFHHAQLDTALAALFSSD